MTLELNVEVRVPPTWPLACACLVDLLSGSLGFSIAVRVRSWKQKNRILKMSDTIRHVGPSESMSNPSQNLSYQNNPPRNLQKRSPPDSRSS